MSQYKKELDAEQKMIADLKKQMETSRNHLLRIMHRSSSYVRGGIGCP